jgi:hypothetical protein
MLVFHLPISRSCPIASRHGQWPDPWAGVTECCSLLAGHREITGGGEASIERGRSGESQFPIVEPQCRPALQIRRHLAHRRVEQDRATRDTARSARRRPWFDAMRSGNFDVHDCCTSPATQCAALRSTPDRARMRSDNRTAIDSPRWPLQSPSSQSRDPLLFRAPWKGVLRWLRSRARGRPRMPPIYS